MTPGPTRRRTVLLAALGLDAGVAAAFWAWICVLPRMFNSAEVHVLAIVLWWRHGTLPWSRPHGLPLIQNAYGPAYEALVRLLPPSASFPYTGGRLVSIVCTVTTLVLIGRWTRRRGAPPRVAVACALLPLTAQPIVLFGALYRVDSLGLLASVAGFLVVVERPGRRATALAAGLFLVAFATKVSFVAAPLAAVLWLLGRDRRRAIELAATIVVAFVAFVGVMEHATADAFLFNAAWANAPARSGGPFDLLARYGMATAFWLVALFVWPGGRQVLRDRRSPGLLYAGTSLALGVALGVNPNMSWNYLMEPVLALALLTGEIAARADSPPGDARTARALAVLSAHALIVLALGGVWIRHEVRRAHAYAEDYRVAEREIAAHEGEGPILVVEWLAGRDVLNRLSRPNALVLPTSLERSAEVRGVVDSAVRRGEIATTLRGTELSPRPRPWQGP